ncbi:MULTISPECIES: efflux RND transporter periplasmic adaptor subunit [unclassified Pseudoxanthomonas]|uniref:efflux RND transporter periplasmic adaptor subunit n=1 Tax=unclassified Pseudoxanthomonas TaxID=2645906 RepID=UPI0008EB9890|nr:MULTISPECIES: efflux RND transporter periplasmic adaptor subunit [unclassified Pseudoxanthomonas]PPJ41889.1 efflux RND transporter periplasmic adaptor subunit [Pseudoxanthomonas sp. KAs_5_3]SFV29311.1 HlyD family secretion protein [Pseudoxanthomonas sp. YR558]
MSQPARSSLRKKSILPNVLFGIAVLALLGGGAWWWTSRKGDTAESAYRTATVERGDIRVAISATGTLSAISTVTVGSQISGQVTDVLVDYNSEVKKGEVLARIDPSTYEAQIAQGNAQIANAQANLKQSQATLANAELDYTRKADLGKQKLVAQSDVDLARAARDQARAQVNAAQASIRQQTASTQTTRVNLDRTVIRSPVDGVVLTRSIEPGQTVAASLQAPELFTIAEDLSKMKIELAVDEADIGQVKVGQSVSFTVDAFADRQFRGEVQQVRLSATTTNNVVTYPVVVSVDNTDGTLLPGLTVNAEIEVSKRDNILKISNAALRYKPTGEEANTAAAATQTPQGGQNRGSGVSDDLVRVAGSLQLKPEQQAAFDSALTALRERQAARMAQAQQRGGASMFGGGPGGGPRAGGNAGGGGAMQAQIRQRMADRMQQDFAPFRATLDDAQKQRWDGELRTLLGAKRAPIYKLVDGKPEMVQVRIGASDGTSTEVSGGVKEGDVVVVGERAKE